MLGDKGMETHLRDRLFYEIIKALEDSICYLCENDRIMYAELLIACRKAETEISDSKPGSSATTAKVKSVVTSIKTSDELISLKEQVAGLVAVVKLNHNQINYHGNKRKNPQANKSAGA